MAEHADTHPIFVYGTLLSGCIRQNVQAQSEFVGPALLEGVQLVNVGLFPGLVAGNRWAVGEVYRFSPEILAKLDQIEGYSPESIEESLFVRQAAEVTLLSGERQAVELYAYAQPEFVEEIEHGDYRRYLQEQTQEMRWVLAFGSNISSRRLEARVGTVAQRRVGHIPGFELVFNKRASGNAGTTYANVRFAAQASTPAVAYLLTEEQVEKLDVFEGVPTHYLRMTLPFLEQGQSQREFLQAYVAHPQQLGAGQPTESYLQHLRNGYAEHECGTLPFP